MRFIAAVFIFALIALVMIVHPADLCAEEQLYRLAWRFVTGGRVVSKPAIDHRGTIYALSDDRNLYAVSPLGKERWRFKVGRKGSCGPVIAYDGSVLVGTVRGVLMAFAPNGRLKWTFSSRSGPCLTPSLARDGSIVLATGDGTIYCLDYMGKERWRYRVRSELGSSVSIARDGTLYIGTSDGRLLALDRDGAKKWELELPAKVGTPAIAGDDSLYVAAAGIHRVSAEGVLLWSYSIPAQTADPVLRADGVVVAGAGNGRLYAISPRGEKLWFATVRVPVSRSVVVGQRGEVYAATDSRELIAVSPRGIILWRFKAKQAVRYQTLDEAGRLYVGAEDWILYALETGSHGLQTGAWPQAYHDGQHTGRAGALGDLNGPAAVLLRELAYSESAELKRMALEMIAAHLDGEHYLAVHLLEMEEVLGYLAGEGVLYRISQSDTLHTGYPEIRLEACRLLGELASEGARAVLNQVMSADEDSIIRTAAVDALGKIGYDPDGELARAIMYRIESMAGERVLLACARALYRIIVESGQTVHPDNYRALGTLAQSGVSAKVRERASGYLSVLSQRWRR